MVSDLRSAFASARRNCCIREQECHDESEDIHVYQAKLRVSPLNLTARLGISAAAAAAVADDPSHAPLSQS